MGKNVNFRITVSYDNQNRMKTHINDAFSPLFDLKNGEQYSLRFENANFVCSYSKTKREFLYRDIRNVVVISDGCILYLNNGTYLSVSVENVAKHNETLYDIVLLLKSRCRRRVLVREAIVFPEIESDGRYITDKEPLCQTEFSLTDFEIKKLLCYDYLFDDKMIVFLLAAAMFLVMSIVFRDVWVLLIAVVFLGIVVFLSRFFFEETNGYIKNHQGNLRLMLYDDLLVVRLCYTDLELSFDSMKRRKTMFGLWRLKCGDFFMFVLPIRIAKENPCFFDALYEKIK